MSDERLTRRALNRALLARQGLLARRSVPALQVIEELVGLQAQLARPPFVGLWSRIEGFRPEELLELIRTRQVIRATLMRATIHLWSARDYVALRAALQPALTGSARSVLKDRQATFEMETLLEAARELFRERPRTFTDLRSALLARFPNADERAMGYTARMHLPLAIVPEEREWGYRADAPFTLAEDWLGTPLDTDPRPETLVVRYLAAFGPATPGDFQAWSGLQGAAALFRALRPELEVFRDERKREIYDLPGAPRPPEETPAPTRLIAEFDNLTLSHADRTRVISDEYRRITSTRNGMILSTLLVDGFVAGAWTVQQLRKKQVVTLSPFEPLSKEAREQLAEEAERLAPLVGIDTGRLEIRFEEPGNWTETPTSAIS